MGPELGPIRPPSEACSLLVRVTRNCPWNRCKFCHFYKGRKLEIRPVEEVEQDILAAKAIQDRILESEIGSLGLAALSALENSASESAPNVANWLCAGGRGAFLQDANTLVLPADELEQIIRFLRQTLPSIERVTTYGRSRTAARRTVKELTRLREAGLSRIHIGLESGYDSLLEFMDKGATAAVHIRGGRNVVDAGISLCEYVVLGLGGVDTWRAHAIETARVLNEINPEYIRLRTLSIADDMVLHAEVAAGNFTRSTDEQVVVEEKLFIENLVCRSNVVSDHMTNLLPELAGRLPEDKHRMLATIDRFQALPARERAVFRVGRRLGLYCRLDDLNDPGRHAAVERKMARLGRGRDGQPDE